MPEPRENFALRQRVNALESVNRQLSQRVLGLEQWAASVRMGKVSEPPAAAPAGVVAIDSIAEMIRIWARANGHEVVVIEVSSEGDVRWAMDGDPLPDPAAAGNEVPM